MSSSTDRIEKTILLRAPRARVWRALTDHREFGSWFGVELGAPFRESASARGRKTRPGCEHLTFEIRIVRMDAERLFSYRWHPYPVAPGVDAAGEPTTLVEFRLEETEGGTRLTVVESGFDAVPAARRAETFKQHEAGWAEQVQNVARHVGSA
jgi:uncharacterized protein YndB with AHSA1/START domain